MYGPAFQPPPPRLWSWVSHSTVPLPPVVWWGCGTVRGVGTLDHVYIYIYIFKKYMYVYIYIYYVYLNIYTHYIYMYMYIYVFNNK